MNQNKLFYLLVISLFVIAMIALSGCTFNLNTLLGNSAGESENMDVSKVESNENQDLKVKASETATFTLVPAATETLVPSETPTATATLSPTATATATNTPTEPPLPTQANYRTDDICAADDYVPVGPDRGDIPEGVSPLTGLPVSNAETLDFPPVGVSISHLPAYFTRPLTGISWANWVYEVYIGEGGTRFLGIFHGDFPNEEIITKENAASIETDSLMVSGLRSSRVAYIDVLRQYHACLISGYSDPTVASQVNICGYGVTANTDNIGSTGVSFARLENIARENAKHTTNLNLTGNVFDCALPNGYESMPAEDVTMYYNFYNQTKWLWDAEKGSYQRYSDGFGEYDGNFVQSVDRITGDPLMFENVIFLFVPHKVVNSAGTIIELSLSYNFGPAYIMRDGQLYKAYWMTSNSAEDVANNETRPLRLVTDTDGTPFPLHPGSTWVNLITPYSYLKEGSEGKFDVRFVAPVYGE